MKLTVLTGTKWGVITIDALPKSIFLSQNGSPDDGSDKEVIVIASDCLPDLIHALTELNRSRTAEPLVGNAQTYHEPKGG